MQFHHIAIETSHGVYRAPGVDPWSVVEWGIRYSASLSNSIVNATSACDNSAGSGSRSSMAAILPQGGYTRNRRIITWHFIY
jgi:hypothetical protein